MIQDIIVNYQVDALKVALSTDTEGDNDTYNLSDLFERIIIDSEVNPDIVIKNLIESFDYVGDK